MGCIKILVCGIAVFVLGAALGKGFDASAEEVEGVSVVLNATQVGDKAQKAVSETSTFRELKLAASVKGVEEGDMVRLEIYQDKELIASGEEAELVAERKGMKAGKYAFVAKAIIMRGSLELGPIASETKTITVFPVILESDIVDEPPPGSTYASGINKNSIVLKLNGEKVTPQITAIEHGYNVRYVPKASQLVPGENKVYLRACDNANAGAPKGANKDDYGNEMEHTFTFKMP